MSNASIFIAAHKGDLAGVAKEIARGVDINLLQLAAQYAEAKGHKEVAQIIGASMKGVAGTPATSAPERTPTPSTEASPKQETISTIHLAAYNGDVAGVAAEIARGVDMNSSVDGKTALHLAAGMGHTDVVKLLLAKGCRTDLVDEEKRNAAQYAEVYGQKGVAQLIEASMKAAAGTPATSAPERTPTPSTEASPTQETITAIHLAAHKGDVAGVAAEIARGVDINYVNAAVDGKTALHLAAGMGHTDVVKLLLAKGCRTDLVDEGKRNAAQYAEVYGQKGVAQLIESFMKATAGTPATSVPERTPTPSTEASPTQVAMAAIHFAAYNGDLAGVAAEIARGVDINLAVSGKTALHLAVGMGHTDVVKLLLAKGCRTDLVDEEKRNAAQYAEVYGQKEVAQLIESSMKAAAGTPATPTEASPKQETISTIYLAAHNGDLAGVTAEIARGVDMNYANAAVNGKTALHLAAGMGHTDVVKLLLAKGCRTDLVDEGKRNAAQYAEVYGQKEVAQLIAAAGTASTTTSKRLADVMQHSATYDNPRKRRKLSADEVMAGDHIKQVLQPLVAMLRKVTKNPANPAYNHYMFESISALVKYNAPQVADIEEALFAPFAEILQGDVSEFLPYVFQIYAQMLELRSDIPACYAQLLPFLVRPELYANKGNVPAVVRFLGVFIEKDPQMIVTNHHLNPAVNTANTLCRSKTMDHDGFALLSQLLLSIPAEHLDQPMLAAVLNDLLRATTSKTDKFAKMLVIFLGQVINTRGPDALVRICLSIQPNMWDLVYNKLWSLYVCKVDGDLNKKAVRVAFIRILTESEYMLAPERAADWAKGLQLFLDIMTNKEQAASREGGFFQFKVHDVEKLGEKYEEGYTNSYCPLACAAKTQVDHCANIAAIDTFFSTQFQALTKRVNIVAIVQQHLPPAHREIFARATGLQ